MGLINQLAEGASTSFYSIAGRPLRIETGDDRVERWVTEFLSGFHLKPTLALRAAEQSAITLRITRGTAPTIPAGLQTFEINQGICHTDGSRYFLLVNDSLVAVAAPETHLVEVHFGSTPTARHPVALVNAFSYGLQAALRRAGLFDLHAAALFDPTSNAGALFVGASSSGKTTMTLKLAECGWRYLSDDMVVLVDSPAGLEMAGLRRLFAVAATSLAGSNLPGICEALGDPVASDPSKRKLEPERIFQNGRTERARPRVLFFQQLTGRAETIVEPLTPSAAMQRLVRLCPWATYDEVSAHAYLQTLARLAAQCRSYLLRAGRDLLQEPRRTADLLGSYMEG